MKKFSTITLILLLIIVFSLPPIVLADTKAGIKPGSFFYFFDTNFEKVGLFFTFNSKKKAEKALGYANERLAEVQAIEEEKNPDVIKTAITNYENNVALATEKSKEVKDKDQAENLLNLIADNTSKNQEVLSAVLIKVPEEAKEAITQAIEASRKNQEEAVKQIAKLKGEVEQLKKEVAELKTQNEEQEKTIEEVSKQKTETSFKLISPQISATIATPKLTTITSQLQTNKQQNTQPTSQSQNNTTNTTPTPTTQTQTSITIQISSVSVVPSLSSAKIEWQTNIPTNSKVFLSGGSLSSKVYNSESGFSTRHIVNAMGLASGTTYSYEIESIAGDQVAKKQEDFKTLPQIKKELKFEKILYSIPIGGNIKTFPKDYDLLPYKEVWVFRLFNKEFGSIKFINPKITVKRLDTTLNDIGDVYGIPIGKLIRHDGSSIENVLNGNNIDHLTVVYSGSELITKDLGFTTIGIRNEYINKHLNKAQLQFTIIADNVEPIDCLGDSLSCDVVINLPLVSDIITFDFNND